MARIFAALEAARPSELVERPSISCDEREDMDRRRKSAIWSLPFTLTFAILFLAIRISQKQTHSAVALQRQIKDMLQSGELPWRDDSGSVSLSSVKSLEQVFKWLEHTYVPLFWSQGSNRTGIFLEFNRVVGGARIQQWRLTTSECPGSHAVREAYSMTCYSTKGELDSSPLGVAQTHDLEGFTADEHSVYTHWLDIGKNRSGIVTQVQKLQLHQWLSSATDRVGAQLALYNGQFGFFILVEVAVALERNGGLSASVKTKTLSVQFDRFGFSVSWFGDLLVLIMLAYLLFSSLAAFFVAHTKGRLPQYVSNMYTWVNLACAVMGIGFCIFQVYLAHGVLDVCEELPKVVAPADASSANVRVTMNTFYDNLTWFADCARLAELASFWYTFIILLKFFQAFEGNAQLAEITSTLRSAFSDLYHFGLVFMCVFIMFALGAFFLFGNHLKEWSSLALCMNSGFRALMGDFDYYSMHAVSPVTATVWFWTYMILLYLIMLNMFLAIIMEAYFKVHTSNRKKSTFWKQVADNKPVSKFKRVMNIIWTGKGADKSASTTSQTVHVVPITETSAVTPDVEETSVVTSDVE